MFCKNQGVQLNKTHLEDGLIVWQEFDENLLFIGIASGGVPEHSLRLLLELSYHAIVLLLGQNGLETLGINPERLKRELKHALPIMDQLLVEVDSGLVAFTECILSNENQVLLEKLSEFSDRFGSPYACLIVRGKIAVATEGWWDLNAIDRKLLDVMLQTSTMPLDVPVYLPKKSPNVSNTTQYIWSSLSLTSSLPISQIAYRLITVPILQNVSLCVLCGAEPLYMEVQALSQQIYAPVLISLQAVDSCYPRNIPTELDEGVLGLLLINRQSRKCVITRNVDTGDQGKRQLNSNGHRLDILKSFHNQAADMMDELLNRNVKSGRLKALESYWSSDYYKLHAMVQGDNLICVMFTAAIPIHTMRLISRETLAAVRAERDLCF